MKNKSSKQTRTGRMDERTNIVTPWAPWRSQKLVKKDLWKAFRPWMISLFKNWIRIWIILGLSKDGWWCQTNHIFFITFRPCCNHLNVKFILRMRLIRKLLFNPKVKVLPRIVRKTVFICYLWIFFSLNWKSHLVFRFVWGWMPPQCFFFDLN